MLTLSSTQRIILIVHVLLLATVIVGASAYVARERATYLASLDREIAAERATLTLIADRAGRNQSIDGVDQFVVDCEERNHFERLLGALGTLSPQELKEVSGLFDACGDYFAAKKGAVVLVLEHHVITFQDLVSIRQEVAPSEADAALLTVWEKILDVEKKRRDILFKQVALQKVIIEELERKAGRNVINATMQEAQAAGELLSVLNKQIESLREEEKNIGIDP